jgi:hypothetical protein
VTVTGEMLHEELRVAAAAAGVSLHKFARPLFSEPNWKLEQLRIAKHPTQLTIDRVRALVGGLPIPPSRGQYIRDPRAIGLSRAEAEDAGIPPSARSVNEHALLSQQAAAKARVELNRQLAELAHQTRRPGQCLADRVRELRRECLA